MIFFNDFYSLIGDIFNIKNYYDFIINFSLVYSKLFNDKSLGVLKINETDFIWLDIVDEDNINKIIEKAGVNQAVLSEFSKKI